MANEAQSQSRGGMLDDLAELFGLGEKLLNGEKSAESLLDEAADKIGLGEKVNAVAPRAPAPVLRLVGKTEPAPAPAPEEETSPGMAKAEPAPQLAGEAA